MWILYGFWLHKLHQNENIWQRVSRLCPDPLGVHETDDEREGKKGGLKKAESAGGLVLGLDPQDLWQIAATAVDAVCYIYYEQWNHLILSYGGR